MTLPIRSALWFVTRASLSEVRLKVLCREVDAGRMVVTHCGGADTVLPALPWPCERVDAAGLTGCGAEAVFRFDSPTPAVSGGRGKDVIKQLLPPRPSIWGARRIFYSTPGGNIVHGRITAAGTNRFRGRKHPPSSRFP